MCCLKRECYFFSPDDKVTSQMLHIGYDPSKGFGKQQTGIIEPICPAPRQLHSRLECLPGASVRNSACGKEENRKIKKNNHNKKDSTNRNVYLMAK